MPPAGYRVFRLEFTRRHLAFAAVLLAIAIGGLGGVSAWTLHRAEARVGELRSLASDQRRELEQIDARASALDRELRSLRTQNDQIRKIMDAAPTPAERTLRAREHAATGAPGESFASVAARIERLRGDSRLMRGDVVRLRGLALRVLDARRVAAQARVRVLAAIPSLNPAGRAGIASSFGWRTDPWPEFHAGVDLDANYGDAVRAAAAGVVAAAGFDGGYGIKIDIDHGNGYHTWYCHLSRAEVRAGERVAKGDRIALVGSTGASTGPHLHYQIMLDGRAVDPEPYLAGVPARVLASLK